MGLALLEATTGAEQGELRSLNVPTIPPNKIFAARSMAGLPFIEYDQGYDSDDWQHSALDMSLREALVVSALPTLVRQTCARCG